MLCPGPAAARAWGPSAPLGFDRQRGAGTGAGGSSASGTGAVAAAALDVVSGPRAVLSGPSAADAGKSRCWALQTFQR